MVDGSSERNFFSYYSTSQNRKHANRAELRDSVHANDYPYSFVMAGLLSRPPMNIVLSFVARRTTSEPPRRQEWARGAAELTEKTKNHTETVSHPV
jgi:hypothetical protein